MREYTKNDLGWLWLDTIENISQKKKIMLSVVLEKGEKLFELEKYQDDILFVLNEDEFKILKHNNIKNLDKSLKEMEKHGVDFISINSNEYPPLLREITAPPIVLYYKGNLELLKTNCITIVGSRLSTSYGKTITETFSKDLAFNGFTIVSGLADGLDTIAHTSCLKMKGKTIAVLCGGLDNIYPSINTNLAKTICENGGLLISEQGIGIETQKYMFPIRNRILAGISMAVLLTEASLKSGTKHTIAYAEDANREIFAVPTSILNTKGSFGNFLIKHNRAILVESAEDIIVALGFSVKEQNQAGKNKVLADIDEVSVLREILSEDETVHFDIILQKSKMDTKKLSSLLTKLELSGIIKKLPSNLYMLCK